MKISLALTGLILAIGLATGWLHRQRLTGLRGQRTELVAKAQTLGISADLPEAERARNTKRQREDRVASGGPLAGKFAAYAREIEANEREGDDPSEDFERRGRELMETLKGLDAAQLKTFIDALNGDAGLSESTRRNLLSGILLTILEDRPAVALEVMATSPDLLKENKMAELMISSALAQWAKEDPRAALEWMRKNATLHPNAADEDAKRSVLAGAAEHDPQLAFRLIGEMGLTDVSSAIETLVETATTAEKRSAILEALRGHLATMANPEQRDELLHESLETLGRNLADESYDSVQAWISSAKLSPAESARFAAGLSYFNTKQDTGRWIGWMAENLPKGELADSVDNLVGQWTQQDYLAAGKWLTTAPAGPAKQAAVSSYAQTVAEYEPQTAVQWALTLPPGEARQDTFQAIYRNWPSNDAEAAEAFAREHGVLSTREAKGEP